MNPSLTSKKMNHRPGRGAMGQRVGFTLVEMMVAVMIIAIMGSFSLMAARNMFPRMRVDRTSSRLAFQLQLARSEAIANNQSVRVWLDTTQNTLRVWVDQNRDGVQDADEIKVISLGDGPDVSLVSSWSVGIFNAYGQFITVPGQRIMQTETTTISSSGGQHTVQLTVRGSGAITKR